MCVGAGGVARLSNWHFLGCLDHPCQECNLELQSVSATSVCALSVPGRAAASHEDAVEIPAMMQTRRIASGDELACYYQEEGAPAVKAVTLAAVAAFRKRKAA